jgi:alanine dehydrogenase
VLVETGAGAGIGASDADYVAVGAQIAPKAADVFARAEMIVKVKEPLAPERAMLRPGQILFTYLHLAADPVLTQELLASGATCVAYETVTAPTGGLPLLAPMSAVAGRMAVQAAAHALEAPRAGLGILMGGIDGAPPARVLVLGGGIVGSHAADVALGMGAQVTVVDRSEAALDRLKARFADLTTVASAPGIVEALLPEADVVVIGVLIPGAAAPHLITAETLKTMRKGSVIVDVAIDQGGGAETSHATTHTDPTYVVEGVVHYCVANMPGAVPRTSTLALNAATLPFVLALADGGLDALRADPHLAAGLNVHAGLLTEPHVAAAFGLTSTTPAAALG